jgi:hypothetical protein
MSAETYQAELVGPDGSETVELEFIGGLPLKSLVRADPADPDDKSREVVWELDDSSKGVFRYEPAGRPAADY